MAFNLKEYILFREEIKRELFNVEVDENFKAVSNPWVDYRRYEIGQIVYHPVTIESTTGETTPTGGPEEYLTWWRANTRTTYGVFDMTQWDIIGGIGGFTNITIAGSKSFGKILANWTPPIALPWSAAPNGLLEATSPTDTFKFVAGTGMSIEWNATEEAMQFTNTGALGEINHGDNVGIGGEDVYVGMSGGVPNNLEFKGFDATNVGGPALTISTDGSNNIVYDFDEGQVDLAALNAGSPLIEMLSDVNAGAVAGQILQYNGAAWQPVAVAVIGANNIYDTSATIAAATRTVTLNAGAGHLKFANGADGLGINNNGLSYVIGENVTTFPAHLIDFNANDILDFQIRLTNSDANGNASINLEPGDGRDYTMGVHNVLVGDSYWSLNRGSSQASLANDDLSIDLNGALWVNNWGIPSYTPPVPKQAAHYVPFAAPSGLIQGKTYTELDLVWTYDGTDGTNSNAKQFFINIDSLGGIPDVGSSSKLGLFVTNIPNEDFTEDNVGIYVYARNHTNDPTGVAQRVQGILSTISDQSGPDTLVNSRVGFWDDGSEGLTGLYGFHSNLKHMLPDADISVGFAGITQGEQIRQIGLGAILHDDAVLTNYFGVYTDVINTTAEPENGFSEITDTGIWAGFFRGCVNITEGGLRLDPQVGPPSCNGNPDETLWINSVDGHVYRGNVDLEDIGGMITLCDLSDVDCPTGGPADGDIIEYDAGLGLWVSVANPGGGANIYNADGTQTDAIRTYTGLGVGTSLKFEGIGTLLTSADRSTHESLVSQYSIDAASYFGVTAGSYIQMDAATNFNVATTNGQVWLDANGLTAQVLIDSDGPISETAATTVTVGAGTAIDITAGTTYDVTSTGNATITTTAASGAAINLDADNNVGITAGVGAVAGSVGIGANNNIILTADVGGTPNQISLVVGTDVTDFISIETQRWSSLGPLGTTTDGPPLIAWNDGSNDVTEYADWTLPKAAGADTQILQYSTALGGAQWVAAGGGGGCCDLQDTMNVGSVAVGLSTDVQIVTSGEIYIESTGDELNLTASESTVKISGCDINILAACDVTGAGAEIMMAAEGNIEIVSSEGNIRLDADGLLEVGDSTGSGYTFPTSTGGLGQILALVGPNTLDWVDDSVFTLCDAPINCPTGEPGDGDTLLYSTSSGAWEVTAGGSGGCCNLQETFDEGTNPIPPALVGIITANDVYASIPNNQVLIGTNIPAGLTSGTNYTALIMGGDAVTTGVPGRQVLINAYEDPISDPDGAKIILHSDQGSGTNVAEVKLKAGDIYFTGTGLGIPVMGDVLAAKSSVNGDVEWVNPGDLTLNRICGHEIDCPTGGPVDGDTLLFDGATGFWALGPGGSGACCNLQDTMDVGSTALVAVDIEIKTAQAMRLYGDQIAVGETSVTNTVDLDADTLNVGNTGSTMFTNIGANTQLNLDSSATIALIATTALTMESVTSDVTISTGIGDIDLISMADVDIQAGVGGVGDIIVGGVNMGTPALGDTLTAFDATGALRWTTPSAGGNGIYGGSGTVDFNCIASLQAASTTFGTGVESSINITSVGSGNTCTDIMYSMTDANGANFYKVMDVEDAALPTLGAGHARIGLGNSFGGNENIGRMSANNGNSCQTSFNIKDDVSSYAKASNCGARITGAEGMALSAAVTYSGTADPIGAQKTAAWFHVNSNIGGASAVEDNVNPYYGTLSWAGHSGTFDNTMSIGLQGYGTYTYLNGTGNLTGMAGYTSNLDTSGSTGGIVTNAYNYFSSGVNCGSDKVTNAYGLYLEPHTNADPSLINLYGIFQEMGANSDINVFCADVNICNGQSLKIHNAGDPPGQGGTPSNFNEFYTPGSQAADVVYELPQAGGSSGQVLTTDGGAPQVLSWTDKSLLPVNTGQASCALGAPLPLIGDEYLCGGVGGWSDPVFTEALNFATGLSPEGILPANINCGFVNPISIPSSGYTAYKICGHYWASTGPGTLGSNNVLEVMIVKVSCDTTDGTGSGTRYTVTQLGTTAYSDWVDAGEDKSMLCFDYTIEMGGATTAGCTDFIFVGFQDVGLVAFSSIGDKISYRLDCI